MSSMLIVGLGNPGNEYLLTRHNIGFTVVDKLANHFGISRFKQEKKICEHADINLDTGKIILLKPLTFMNNSGQAVSWAQHFFKVLPENILVVYDDIALPLGQIRIRKKGSDGGHNGMKSIIAHLGQDFPRIRLGIMPEHPVGNLSSFVLENFSKSELKIVADILNICPELFGTILQDGIDTAMNKYN